MRAITALLITAFVASAMASGPSVRAQEAVPETPSELRDFRLDKPSTQPQAETQPSPMPGPLVAPPPPAVRTQTQPEPSTRRTEKTVEPTRRDSAQTDTRSTNTTDTEPEATPEEVLSPLEAKPPSTLPAPVIATEVERDKPALPYWQIAAALAALGLLAMIAFWVRRIRGTAPEYVSDLPELQPEPVMDVEPTPTITPDSSSTPTLAVAAEPIRNAIIAIRFVPEKATVTFATLTIKGQLQVSNEGTAGVHDMQLRAGLISASHQQQEAASQFFSTARNIIPNSMGNAKAGETIGMELELLVSLSEMQSFPLGDQRLLVPIILATIEYRTDDQTTPQHAEIACMIGRESTPPKAKMGPLRLDLGPRSFAPLGARPLYT